VHAFVGIAGELERHGAPAALVRAAVDAAKDELRHTWLCGALARRYGAEPALPVVAPTPDRPLVALAIENAAEGCVRETYGALVATWQARTSIDPVVRAAMARIAADETRHAELSAAIDRWARTRLSADDRADVEAARSAAIEALGVSAVTEPAPELVANAGLPRAADAAALVRGARAALWA
jgi:hypothetical protein